MARKRVVLIPAAIVFVLALAVFLLGRNGAFPAPWAANAEAADASGSAGEGDDEDEEEEVPVPVELARADTRPIAAFYRASSFVEADRQVSLVAKTTGRVRRVNAEEGDWVDQGEILAELENDRERIRSRQEELRLAEAKRDLDRSASLREQSLITQETFDSSRSAFELAETERDLAAVALEETILRAPFDGQVTQRMVVPGQHINISEPLFTLVDFSPLRVRISLPEAIARRVRAGDEVHVLAESLPDAVPAVVERIAPVVDPQTSTVLVTLLVDDAAEVTDELRVGGFVKVRITTDTHEEALSIPKLALVEEGSLRSVFVVDADSVRKIEVRTGLHDESHIEVLEGVREGDLVVSLGQGGLRTGSKIDVLNADDVGWVAPQPEGDESDGEDDAEDAEGDDAAVELAAEDTELARGEGSSGGDDSEDTEE